MNSTLPKRTSATSTGPRHPCLRLLRWLGIVLLLALRSGADAETFELRAAAPFLGRAATGGLIGLITVSAIDAFADSTQNVWEPLAMASLRCSLLSPATIRATS